MEFFIRAEEADGNPVSESKQEEGVDNDLFETWESGKRVAGVKEFTSFYR